MLNYTLNIKVKQNSHCLKWYLLHVSFEYLSIIPLRSQDMTTYGLHKRGVGVLSVWQGGDGDEYLVHINTYTNVFGRNGFT